MAEPLNEVEQALIEMILGLVNVKEDTKLSVSSHDLGILQSALSKMTTGPTLRDQLAMAALPTLLTEALKGPLPDETWRVGVALDVWRMADAMLEARDKKEGE